MNAAQRWFGGGEGLARPRLWVPLLIIYMVGLTTLSFGRWMPEVFFGDDLSNLLQFHQGTFASSLWQSLTTSNSEKYRPVFALLMQLLYSSFDGRIELYMVFNVVLNAVSGLVLGLITLRLTNNNRPLALLAVTMGVTSRFLLYQVTQVTGILEGTGYLLFLATIWQVLAFHDETAEPRKALRSAVLSLVCAWLLIFTHERYLLVAPWAAAMLLMSPNLRLQPMAARLALPVLALGAMAAHLGYKMLVLKEAVMVGTGGTHIRFDLAGMIDRLTQAALSVLSFNHGPDYLAGRAITSNLMTVSGAFATLFVLCLAGLLVLGARPPRTAPDAARSIDLRPFLVPASLVVLTGLVLVPPLLTIRMEQRWLVEPFALLIMIAAWFAGRVSARQAAVALGLFASLTMASMVVNWRVSKAFPNIFFVSSGEIAESVKEDVVDVIAQPTRLAIVAGPDVCTWVLLQGEFFRYYAREKAQATCVNTLTEVEPEMYAGPRPARIYTVQPDYSVTDVSATAYAGFKAGGAVNRQDFVSRFPEGKINDDTVVETPTGKGALILDIDMGAGPVKTLTLLTGFAYRYDKVKVRPGDSLSFDVAMVYPTQGPARAKVTAIKPDGSTAVLFAFMPPLRAKDGPVQPVRVNMPLNDVVGDIALVFSVETPGVDKSGHWMAFAQPRIVSADPLPGAAP